MKDPNPWLEQMIEIIKIISEWHLWRFSTFWEYK
jgi:hypothetical protein